MTNRKPQFRRVRSNWRTVILVCRKCERRMGDRGFGPRGRGRLTKSLKMSVKAFAKARGGKSKGRAAPLGIVQVGCQKLCPRAGVTVVLANRPDCWLIVEKGAAPEQVLALAGVDLTPHKSAGPN
jgi:hypothetical protein